jgi:His-Xaa-Ser system protein HxsD
MNKKNEISVLVDSKVYSLEAIYSAAYLFLDDAYFYLEENSKSKIKVNIKSKDNLNDKKLENLKDEFLNELLNSALREKISKNNKKMREYILGKVLNSALVISSEKDNMEDCCSDGKESWDKKDLKKEFMQDLDNDWEEDLEGIAIPWEEKYLNSSELVNEKNNKCVKNNSKVNRKKNNTLNKKNKKNKK